MCRVIAADFRPSSTRSKLLASFVCQKTNATYSRGRITIVVSLDSRYLALATLAQKSLLVFKRYLVFTKSQFCDEWCNSLPLSHCVPPIVGKRSSFRIRLWRFTFADAILVSAYAMKRALRPFPSVLGAEILSGTILRLV